MFFTQIGVAQFRSRFLRLDLVEAGVDGNARDPVLERHLARVLRQFLKYFDEYHLTKILLGHPRRTMGAHQFGHERIKPLDQPPRRFIIVPKRALDQSADFRFLIHVHQNAHTLFDMTMTDGRWLQK